MENTLVRWKETYDRSIELADVSFTLLSTVMDYCKSHNIPLYNEKGIWNLVSKAQSILQEIENINLSSKLFRLADGKKQYFRTDEEETEPLRVTFNSQELLCIASVGG